MESEMNAEITIRPLDGGDGADRAMGGEGYDRCTTSEETTDCEE